MERTSKLYAAKVAVIMGAIPVLLWAYEYGPDPGYSGVPKEQGTCTASGCHVGTTNDPANKGSVSVAFPSGACGVDNPPPPGLPADATIDAVATVPPPDGISLLGASTARLQVRSIGAKMKSSF